MNRMLAPLLIPTVALTAAPAFAHSGAHFHPHDAGILFTVALALGVVAMAIAVLVLRK